MQQAFDYPRLLPYRAQETALQDGLCSLLHSCATEAAQAMLQRQGHGELVWKGVTSSGEQQPGCGRLRGARRVGGGNPASH